METGRYRHPNYSNRDAYSMKIPRGSKYESFCYVEIAHFVPKLNRVIRLKENDDPVLLRWGSEVDEWRIRQDNVGLYTSVFHYNAPNIKALRLGSLYFDLDDKLNPHLALNDARTLTKYLYEHAPEESVRLYFTGEKGYHIEVEAITLGVDPSNGLARTYRYIATALTRDLQLTTIDSQVYEPRRMWRLPSSQHQNTGLYKTLLTKEELFGLSHDELKVLASKMQPDQVPDPQFSSSANEWYRSWGVREEEESSRQAQERIARFFHLGTDILPNQKPSAYVYAAFRSELERLQESAEGTRNHTLNRAAFCLYQYVFNGSLDDEYVTDTLQRTAWALGLTELETQATLNSARQAAEKTVTMEG